MSKKRGSVGGSATRPALSGTHPDAAGATNGRHAVRPRLRPFGRVAQLVRPALAGAPPVGELYNGRPTDVMLQGFHVTSCQSRSPSWYAIVAQNAIAIAAARFDVVWMPPPSASVDQLGYLPTRWQVLDSSYGTSAELEAALTALGTVTPIADVVVNHRCGVATAGADFADPAFALPDQAAAVCRNDEWGGGTGNYDTGENQAAARDLDHMNAAVQQAIEGYETELAAVGFRGWRYDEARGYGGEFVQIYNDASQPYLSVGEFWDADRQNVMNWIDATRGRSMAFDFPTRAVLKDALARRQFGALKTVDGKPTGAIGWWPAMSVTFIENHDTDKESSHPDEFGTGDQVLQGYAYLLTHPGIPCVFWPHFFDYGAAIRDKLTALIAIRKAQGLNRDSVVNIAAADDGRYAAIVDEKVAVKLGPGPWDPGGGWSVATDGDDFAVWTRAGS
jgi:alpha-amylase